MNTLIALLALMGLAAGHASQASGKDTENQTSNGAGGTNAECPMRRAELEEPDGLTPKA